MQPYLLRDQGFQLEAKKLAKELEDNINSIGNQTYLANPQTLHKEFKNKIKEAAIQHAKQATPKMQKRINKLEEEHEKARNDPDKSEPERMALASSIQDQIEQLKRKRFQKAKTTLRP